MSKYLSPADDMRIVHADTDDLDNPLRGGQPVRTFEINSRLAKRHEVTVLTASFRGCRRSVFRGSVAYRRLGVTVPGLGLSPHLSFLASLGPVLRRLPHDLVVEEFTPPIGFCLLPFWTDKPVISIVQWFSFDAWQSRYRLPFERMMTSVAGRGRYRYFIAQTSTMADYFASLVPTARVWTLGCGLSEDAFQPTSTAGSYAMFLGRLDEHHKGLDFIIEAWAKLKRGGTEVPLLIVGEGAGRGNVERAIKANRLEKTITLMGRAEGDRKHELLRNCAMLVMPSRNETFGIVALEAMASSKPIVAFDIPNLNEVLRPDYAILVPPFDVDALSDAIASLWRDPTRRGELGVRAFQASQQRRWSLIAEQQEQIYHHVLDAEYRP